MLNLWKTFCRKRLDFADFREGLFLKAPSFPHFRVFAKQKAPKKPKIILFRYFRRFCQKKAVANFSGQIFFCFHFSHFAIRIFYEKIISFFCRLCLCCRFWARKLCFLMILTNRPKFLRLPSLFFRHPDRKLGLFCSFSQKIYRCFSLLCHPNKVLRA